MNFYFVVVSVALLFAIQDSFTTATEHDKNIGLTTSELMEMIKAKTVTLIDVRRPDELENEGKISGSVNIPTYDLQQALSLSPGAFQSKYRIPMPAKDDCNLVFHCKTGGRSLRAVTLARKMGWYCSRHLLGGFDAWKRIYM